MTVGRFMRALSGILIFISLFAVGCANEDGSRKTTKLVVENVYKPSVHSQDCRRGMNLKVTVKGRTYETGTISTNTDWDYELTREKNAIPYSLEVSCLSDSGERSKATLSGEIPAKSDAAVLKGIIIGPPRLAQAESCEDATPGSPCIQFN